MSPSSVIYREATAEDAGALGALLLEIMDDHGARPPASDKLALVIRDVLAAADHTFMVAEAGGRIVGMCALIFSLSTWSAAPVCELQDVIVARSARRAQIGRGMLRAAERLAKERGCARLFLSAESWNLGARAFYSELGFSEKTCSYFERDLLAP